VEEGPATHSRVCDSSMGREIECRAQCLFAGVSGSCARAASCLGHAEMS
jgi:hypothetical protein